MSEEHPQPGGLEGGDGGDAEDGHHEPFRHVVHVVEVGDLFAVDRVLDGGVEESEGGMVLFRSLIHDKFHCLGEALPMVFEEAYDDSVQGFVLLSDRFLPGPRTTD